MNVLLANDPERFQRGVFAQEVLVGFFFSVARRRTEKHRGGINVALMNLVVWKCPSGLNYSRQQWSGCREGVEFRTNRINSELKRGRDQRAGSCRADVSWRIRGLLLVWSLVLWEFTSDCFPFLYVDLLLITSSYRCFTVKVLRGESRDYVPLKPGRLLKWNRWRNSSKK